MPPCQETTSWSLAMSTAWIAARPAPRLLDQLHAAPYSGTAGPRPGVRFADWVRRYILFHNRRHPRELGADSVRSFLEHVAQTEGSAALSGASPSSVEVPLRSPSPVRGGGCESCARNPIHFCPAVPIHLRPALPPRPHGRSPSACRAVERKRRHVRMPVCASRRVAHVPG
jgi:hypothetical protein